MELVWLQSLLIIAEEKSLSRASQKLNISQPALSKQIKKLEHMLNSELLNRSPQGVELTKSGERTLDYAKKVLSEWKKLQSDLALLQAEHIVQIGSLPSLASQYLPLKLLHFPLQQHIQVEDNSQKLMAKLLEGDIDIAFVELQQDYPNTYQKPLFSEPLFLIVSANHIFANRDQVTFADVIDQPFLLYPMGCDSRYFVNRMFAKLNKKPRIAHETPYGQSILGYVRAGRGITVLPYSAIKDLKQEEIKAIPINENEAIRTIFIVSTQKELLEQFTNHIKEVRPT
ncbi:LysR family transcriptional regulator [Hazenella sp. IB182357]|uniref:LysR family transcriptional regulator n=1 Tax=Polycladospora coralii TaxID=2771432 RepID=A0A926NC51_9BACL|nr:LysR family transcriptional regulator [Polycladospora coralii]MBD1373090.1 LysR family transcriptional regulator [Polycladospora coralii]MBS7529564.1 LysR family transcriptional regulator [Polycladospora coralii]